MNRLDSRLLEKKDKFGIKKILVIVLAIVLLIFGVQYFSNSRFMDEKNLLSEAISRDMIHCYCVEGFYPPDIEYMEEHFGLKYDKEKYFVDYKVVGKNIMPTYEIVELEN